jgi:copper chaperone CopZ
MLQEEMIQVSGIRCERCVTRLGLALEGHPGLEQAQANLVGQVLIAWDDEQTTRDALVDRLAENGFFPA